MSIPQNCEIVNSQLRELATNVVAKSGILDTEMNDFVDWLNAELERRGWSNSELGRRAGVTGGAISHLLNKRTNPSLDTYRGIAHAFDMSLEDVLRAAGELPAKLPAVAKEERATYLIRSLSENRRQTAIEVLESLKRADERDARRIEERRTSARHTQPQPESTYRQLPSAMNEVEAWFYDQLALLPPDASDTDVRRIVIETISRIWDEGTDEERVFLVRLFEAFALVKREERQNQPTAGQSVTAGE